MKSKEVLLINLQQPHVNGEFVDGAWLERPDKEA